MGSGSAGGAGAGAGAGPRPRRRILHGVSGRARPGEVLALMGPSGSGKTTLLDCLHPERQGSGFSGSVRVSPGGPMKKWLKRHLAYVRQEDELFKQLTVRETLLFTAQLRLAGSEAEKRAQAEAVTGTLGLSRCQGTQLALCSGGEKKRTSIAIEMLTDPAILLLDEPTSGLDSTMAAALLSTLKAVAREGRTVVSSLHQPSSIVFAKLDAVMLLCNGRTVFQGPPSAAVPYFEGLGFACPAMYNPADFAMDLLVPVGEAGDMSSGAGGAGGGGGGECGDLEHDGASTQRRLIEAFEAGACPTAHFTAEGKGLARSGVVQGCSPAEAGKGGEGAPGGRAAKWNTGWLYQTAVLSRRSFKVAYNDLITPIALFECCLISAIAGGMWWQTPWTESRTDSRAAFVFFTIIFWCFNALFNSLMSFPSERPILERERASGSYRLSAYYLSKTLAESPLRFVYPTIYLSVAFWMAGIRNDFGVWVGWVAVQLLVVFGGESLGFFLGTTFANVRRGIAACTITAICLMLSGGFFLTSSEVPAFLRWIRYLSPFSYGYNAAAALVFNGKGVPCDGSGVLVACGGAAEGEASPAEVLEALGVRHSPAFNAGMLALWCLGMRLWGYCHLRFLPRSPAGPQGGPARR